MDGLNKIKLEITLVTASCSEGDFVYAGLPEYVTDPFNAPRIFSYLFLPEIGIGRNRFEKRV